MNTRAIDHRTKLSRRRVLGGLGALTVAITSPIWRVATVFGQDAKAPSAKRFIGIFSADGTIPAQFFPPANDGATPLMLPRILAPLEKHKAKLLVLKGVHMNSTVQNELGKNITKPGGPHMKGPGAMLTGGSLLEGSFTGAGGPAGYADRISVDQLIAQRLGSTTKFPSLELGVRVIGPGPLAAISFRGPNQPNLPVNDPWKVYSRIFANQDLSATELARRLAERRSVLDFLKDDLNRLAPRISAEDKHRLDAHLTGIRSIEQGLTHAGPSCSPMQMPAKLNPDTQENYPALGKLQMDLMLLAHSCDLTRVSTLMWSNANSWQRYSWLGVNDEHHELSHSASSDAAATEKLVKVAVWHTEQVAHVVDRLAATPEADGGTMLDRTLLLWGNEIGVGNTHTYKDIPWLMAGGAGGYLKTGRSLLFKDQPHNNLLLSVCHAMGLTDVQSFGIPALCTGPLPGLV